MVPFLHWIVASELVYQIIYLGINIPTAENDVKVHIVMARTAFDRLIIWQSDVSEKITQDLFQTIALQYYLLVAPH